MFVLRLYVDDIDNGRGRRPGADDDRKSDTERGTRGAAPSGEVGNCSPDGGEVQLASLESFEVREEEEPGRAV